MPSTLTSTTASIEIAGIRLCNIDLAASLDAMDAALQLRLPTRIAFVNADCVNIAGRDPGYRDDLARMDWVFADGVGIHLAGKLLGQPVSANVNGTDLFPLLCARLAERRARLFLLGGRPGVAAAAARSIEERHPGVMIAGSQQGYFAASEEAEIVRRIRHSRPDVLCVGFGAPYQESWINRHYLACGASINLGVGGLLDYWSGRVPRAPQTWRQLRLEWVFRLLQEPQRLWRRYLIGNPIFIARMAGLYLQQRREKHHD